jgi:hypothetical protein
VQPTGSGKSFVSAAKADGSVNTLKNRAAIAAKLFREGLHILFIFHLYLIMELKNAALIMTETHDVSP